MVCVCTYIYIYIYTIVCNGVCMHALSHCMQALMIEGVYFLMVDYKGKRRRGGERGRGGERVGGGGG